MFLHFVFTSKSTHINRTMKTIVLATGGFDPIHSGHIAYLKAARQLGDILVVGVNSDEWLARKKGRAFMPILERTEIVQNIKGVDFVITFDDRNDSVRHAIEMVRQSYPQDKIIVADGNQRTDKNMPELRLADTNLEFKFNVGGVIEKNSSSWLLEEWRAPKTRRMWGHYCVVHDSPGAKVKELTVEPGAALSMQRHQDRAEFWLVTKGEASVYTLDASTDLELQGRYTQHQYLHIGLHCWHQLVNETSSPLTLIEIQYGSRCTEEDVERRL